MTEPATTVPEDASSDVPNAVDAMLAPIRELGLERYIAELEHYGYTIIPPERVAPARVRRAGAGSRAARRLRAHGRRARA